MAKYGGGPSRLSPVRTIGNRPGEGVVLDVDVKQFTASDGSEVANFNIDLRSAQVPDRKYTADTCAVAQASGTVKIMFGQERVDQTGWRSLLIVHMSTESVSRFLSMLEQLKNPTLDEVVAKSKIAAESLASKASEPDQAIALTANLGFVGIAGNESCVDFYQASPFSIGAVISSKQIALEPVVRVDLRTSLLLGMISGIRSLGIKPQEIKVQSASS